MKKIILPLVFIASAFSTLTNAETLTNANGSPASCTLASAPVTYVFASTSTNGGAALQITIGGKSCWISGLSETRLAMATALLTEAVSSGRNAFVGVVLGNISVQLY